MTAASPRSAADAPSSQSSTPAAASALRPPVRLAPFVIGCAIAVAMWAIGYVTHLRQGLVPGPVVFLLLAATFIAGSIWAGRVAAGLGGHAWRGGAVAAIVSAAINLLILGSLVRDDVPEGADATAALRDFGIAAVVSFAVAAVLGAVAGIAGHRLLGPARAATRSEQLPADDLPAVDLPADDLAAPWRHAMVVVACVATFFVVIAGGLVTSTETGLAVPDWPNTFGSNMFLYPLERMTGGVYFEHAHRLYGALVGLCTVISAVVLWTCGERRGWVRIASIITVVMVCLQGYMGGRRVTGNLTLSQDAADLAPSTAYAIAHGVFGQVFFATMVALAAVTSLGWLRAPWPRPTIARAGTARGISVVLLALLFAQLLSGAGYRHLYTVNEKLPWPAHIHLTLAGVAVIVAWVAGIKAMSCTGPHDRPLRRTGHALSMLVALQLVLGIAAFVAILMRSDAPYAAEVLLATAHQANGALVLVSGALLVVWAHRLPAVAEQTADADADAPGAVAGRHAGVVEHQSDDSVNRADPADSAAAST
ncbi:MAG: heme A synthase [Phycisphaerales bacterium]